MAAVIKMLIIFLAGSGFSKLADTYIKPMLPVQVQPEAELSPGKLFSIRTIWVVAVGVIASMIVLFVGRKLNIKFLKRKI